MWLQGPFPKVILAPMDGYTDPPFRRFIKSIEPRAVVFSEFLPSTLVAQKPSLAKELFEIHEDEQPVVIQLYGKDPEHFRVAAQLAEAQGAAGVDVNMGCPAKKVVAHRHGSALMREIDLACEIIAKMKASIQLPVSVKTRLGWDDEANLIPFALRLQEAGLDAITIHGRTYNQKFDGEARWEPIYALKRALRIPVFGNGDVTSPAFACEKLGPLDGVMVGRGAVSDPWLVRRIADALYGTGNPEYVESFAERVPLWRNFAQLAMSGKGGHEGNASAAFRKYLVKLHKELQLEPADKIPAIRVNNLKQILAVLDLYLERQMQGAENRAALRAGSYENRGLIQRSLS